MHESILIEEPQASVARHSKASVHLAVETEDVCKRLWFLALILAGRDEVEELIFDPSLDEKSLQCIKKSEHYCMVPPPAHLLPYLHWVALQLLCPSKQVATLFWVGSQILPLARKGIVTASLKDESHTWTVRYSRHQVSFSRVVAQDEPA